MQFAKITKVLSAVNVEALYFMDLERLGTEFMRAICSCLITKRCSGVPQPQLSPQGGVLWLELHALHAKVVHAPCGESCG